LPPLPPAPAVPPLPPLVPPAPAPLLPPVVVPPLVLPALPPVETPPLPLAEPPLLSPPDGCPPAVAAPLELEPALPPDGSTSAQTRSLMQVQPVKPSFSQSASVLHCAACSFSSAEQAFIPLISANRAKKEMRFIARPSA
jgi:hypothetical protein